MPSKISRAVGVGVGQVGLGRFTIDAQVNQLAEAASEAVANLAQGVGLGQLAEQHRRQLRPAGEALGVAFPTVLPDEAGELVTGNLLQKLTEQAGRAYHRQALRGCAVNRIFGETQFSHGTGGLFNSRTV